MLIALSATSALLILVGSAILFHVAMEKQRLRRHTLLLERSKNPANRRFAAFLMEQHFLYIEGYSRSQRRVEWLGQAMLVAGAIITFAQSVGALSGSISETIVMGNVLGLGSLFSF